MFPYAYYILRVPCLGVPLKKARIFFLKGRSDLATKAVKLQPSVGSLKSL